MAQSPTLQHHALYDTYKPVWTKARDVYEGAGGFLDPTCPYLVPHPREWLDHSTKTDTGIITNPNPVQPSPKLQMRRKMARYENVAEIILGAAAGALFRLPPARTFKPSAGPTDTQRPIQTWRLNVDGRQTPIDSFLADLWIAAAVFGHALVLTDKPTTPARTAADAGQPLLRAYTALDLIDWLTDDAGQVIAVKLLEPAPRTSFDQRATSAEYRVRIVDAVEWTLQDQNGTVLDGAPHGMGRLPVTFLYGRRRPLTPVIGKSIMGDPHLYIDLYNLQSEVRELLRNQTFAILNVPIGKDGNPEEEQAKIGSQGGTANVLFSSEAISYVSPDGTNVQVYHEHIDRLLRSIYRLSAAPWQGDSKDAESADSLRIKRDEQQQVLAGYAAELQRTDDDLTDLFYRATAGPDKWERQRDLDGTQTRYPDRFDPPNVADVAAQAAEALGLDLGPLATKELKKRTVRHLLPGLAADVLKAIDVEIDGQEIKTAAERQADLLEMTRARFGGQMPSQAEPPIGDGNSDGAAA